MNSKRESAVSFNWFKAVNELTAVNELKAVNRLTAVHRFTSLKFAFSFLALVSSFFIASVSHAEKDPLNYKPNLQWLSNDVNVSVFGEGEYDSFLGKSEVWAKNWGVSAKLLQNDSVDVFGLPADSQFFNFDVKRRVLGSQNRSNVELGLGWQELDIESQFDASGPKVSLSGRYNLFKTFQVYGETAYFPELEDEIQKSELKAYEFEAGLLYQPIPSWSFKAGYRIFSLDLDDAELEDLGSSSGFLLGTDLSW